MKKLQVSEREEEINRNSKLLSLVIYNKIQKSKISNLKILIKEVIDPKNKNISDNSEIPSTINKFSNLQKIFKSNHINVKLDFT